MATDTPASSSSRPRPWLLFALGAVVALYLAVTLWPSKPQPAPVNAPPRAAAKAADNGTVDPEDLKVRLEALKDQRPQPGEVDRNPFRFRPTVPPPPPASSAPPVFAPPPDPTPPQPVGPPPPPPIPLKFIGIVEGRSVGKVAAFSDCKRTFYGREGDIVDGRYRLLKIGVESVTMMYPDGRGQQTIRLSGQECIGK
jgi:hypothetical protein